MLKSQPDIMLNENINLTYSLLVVFIYRRVLLAEAIFVKPLIN